MVTSLQVQVKCYLPKSVDLQVLEKAAYIYRLSDREFISLVTELSKPHILRYVPLRKGLRGLNVDGKIFISTRSTPYRQNVTIIHEISHNSIMKCSNECEHDRMRAFSFYIIDNKGVNYVIKSCDASKSSTNHHR